MSLNNIRTRLTEALSTNDILRFSLIALLVMLAHSNLLIPHYTENPDANTIYPILEDIHSPWEYIKKLVSFETLDFQPLRDATLFIDIWFFEITERTISIFLNCIVWIWAAWQILRILEERYQSDRLVAFTLTCAFSIYPIYSQAINWGIARKHLLAFAFTLMATRYFFRWLKTGSGEFRIILLYTCSLLSLPASMLWPIWATIVIYFTKEKTFPESRKFLSLLFIIMFLLVGINWAYYKSSYTFLEIYPQKASEFDILYSLIHLGHQIKQVVFPYELSFYYSFGTSALVGLVGFLLFIGWLLWKKRKESEIWIWVFYSGAHLIVLLSTPKIYFDTYVLHPSLGLFFIMFLLLRQQWRKLVPAIVALTFFWAGFTYYINPVWGDSVAFFRKSFENQTSCGNAIGYGAAQYLKGSKISNELYDFIQVNTCLEHHADDSPFMSLKKNNFEALQLFHEDEIDYEYRQRRLIELGMKHFYAMSIYVAFLAKYDKAEEVEKVSSILNQKFRESGVQIAYDPIFSGIVPEYCRKRELQACIRFSSMWKSKVRKSYDVY